MARTAALGAALLLACSALAAGYSEVTLTPDATVRARVQFKEKHGGVDLLLCSMDHCSEVSLAGEGSEDGALAYSTSTWCDQNGEYGCSRYSINDYGYDSFSPGELVLEVQHRPGWLAVWREGRSDDVVEVPADQEGELFNTLRIKPYKWASDMAVDFTDITGSEEPATTGAAATTKQQPSTVNQATTTQAPTSTVAQTTQEPTSTVAQTTQAATSTVAQTTQAATSTAAQTTQAPTSASSGPAGAWPRGYPLPYFVFKNFQLTKITTFTKITSMINGTATEITN